jgi:glycosyltransferase involved in cell wall biosynthesis
VPNSRADELLEQVESLRELVTTLLETRETGVEPTEPIRLEPLLAEIQRAIDAIQVVYDQEPENRRRLHALRHTGEYELAFTEDEPLISILIPTYRSFSTLRDRAIPSVLNQTYEHWELVIVGDAAPPETAEVVSSFGDARIRYENQVMRGPYPEDQYDAWLVTAVPPFNAALRLARGRWISPFADDDALRPDALAHVLAHARKHRYEFCYAKLLLHARDGTQEEIGAYPPGIGKSGISAGMQGGLLHGGLRFFEQELSDAIFRTPSDWSMMRRMLRAGVRAGFLDEITCDYYPSYRGEDVPGGQPFR